MSEPATPLPWYKCGGYTVEYISIAAKKTKPRKLVIAGFSDDFTNEEQQQNAAYIVEACNAYAELQKPCVWTKTADGYWRAGCNRSRWKMKYHGRKFCTFCGHPLQEQESSDE